MSSFGELVLAQDGRITANAWVAAIVFSFYDWSLTLNDEVYLIWGHGTWAAQFLYATSRYGQIASLLVACNCALGDVPINGKMCTFCHYWIAYTALAVYSLVGIVLIIRINGLYHRNRRLCVCLFVMLGGMLVFAGVFLSLVSDTGTQTALPGQHIRCLTGVEHRSWAWVYWIPGKMVLDALLLALALGRTLALLLNLRDRPSPLERLLLRDSIFARVAALSVAAANLALWRLPGHSLIFAFPAVAQAVESVVACRLILNIRGFADPPHGQLSLDGDVLRIHSPEDLEDIQFTTMPG